MAHRNAELQTQEYTLEYIDHTDRAILVLTDRCQEVWLPKSQLIEFHDEEDGTCTIVITDELAMEKEII